MFSLLSSVLMSVIIVLISSSFGWWGVIWACQVNAISSSVKSFMVVEVAYLGFSGSFYCDEVSSGFVWLSGFVTGLSLLSMSDLLCGEAKSFFFAVSGLFVVLSVCFGTSSVLVFYMLFEISLIPTLSLICGWGYQPERLRAGKYMMVYTVGASLPLLGFIVFVFFDGGTLSFVLLFSVGMKFLNWVVFLCAMMAFLVKSPAYMVHGWLPKAHVEAPVAGSMFLAGVLLKLGGYGLLRFVAVFGLWSGVVLSCLTCLCLFGGVVASIICCCQVDVKSLVAYSSVGHMSLVLGGLMSESFWGLGGSYLLMLAHGLSSCGLFYLVGELYKVYGSRMLFVMRGGVGNLFGVNLWLAFMCGFNAAAPPSLSLWSEVILCISLISYSMWFSGLVGVLGFLSCLYSWSMYCGTQTGCYPLWVRSFGQISYTFGQGVICSGIVFLMTALSLCCEHSKFSYLKKFFFEYDK
uniref:NADH-ubiquinone oxidoreductase chain 4 n=1 Tax=Rectidens sumatrensis TaxID=1903498 RepID=A0A8A3WFW5_9BIVA|nr:NADH dehydrogenase subunit 4 [Rectidens sumatrensis]